MDGKREKYIVPVSEPDVFVPEILRTHLYTPQGTEGRLRELAKKEESTLKK